MDDEINVHDTARTSAQEREPARFDITIRQASLLFAELGVPRSPRSVQGFCKDGHIDAVLAKGPNGDRYFINRESIERYATELKQIEEVAKIGVEDSRAQEREPARESALPRAEPDPSPATVNASDNAFDQEVTDAVKQLREENLNLRIDNRGKENFINQLVQDRSQLMSSIQDVSYKLGAAESRLLQLEAPKNEARGSAQEREPARSDDVEDVRDADVVATADKDQHGRNAADDNSKRENKYPNVEPPKRSVWNRIFS